MLTMKKGCRVPFPERLRECYEANDRGFWANIDAKRIETVVRQFLAFNNEPFYFVLELPVNRRDEDQPGVFHKDVYYLDGCTRERALAVLARGGERLIHDGISAFGFGCHDSLNEIMSGKYNVITVYTNQPERYEEDFFPGLGLEKVDQLVTAWDTFSSEHPGQCRVYEVKGFDVYSLPKELKEWGLYLAERREDP